MLRLIEKQGPTEAPNELGTLDEIAREGARRMLMMALDSEIAAYLGRHRDEVDGDGRRLVVRNGKAKSRTVTCGAGTMEVRAPRVNDRRLDAEGQRQRFTSQILPSYMRRSPKVAEVLPVLYLRGLSTGDFQPALAALLGEDAAGLSSTNITRLTAVWEAEYRQSQAEHGHVRLRVCVGRWHPLQCAFRRRPPLYAGANRRASRWA